ncbi:UNVERIFIED_CONTAM: hypothetical protein Sradi_1693300 [Sesamum radiatum]|uniref:Uncharacterized protein n=1 Tax=Sesamum radiatum TaxID=300843 RepID=A0AAW2UG98_SESRA
MPMGQTRYYYLKTWTKNVNKAFVNMLYYQARKGYSQSDESMPNEVALEFAEGAVNVFPIATGTWISTRTNCGFCASVMKLFNEYCMMGCSHERLIRTVCMVQNPTGKE